MARITPNEALQRVLTAQQQGMKLAKAVSQKATVTEFVRDIDENVYLFRKGKEGLVLPADNELMPILGETTEGNFTDTIPDPLQDWLAMYAKEVAIHQNTPLLIEEGAQETTADADKPAAEPRKTIPYMVKTKWSQGSPYNNRLNFGDGACMVGCPAVMIGQIMFYWGYKGYRRGCTATTAYSYKGEPYKVSALPPITVFDYAHMTTGKPKTAEEKEAVATLLEYIGKAVKSCYGLDSTWAYTNVYPDMMRDRLRLGSGIKEVNTLELSEAAFAEKVYQELALGRPVGMSGVNDSGSGSHAFVCDGYNAATDKFHFNFGWGGYYDGYYAMSALKLTSTINYNIRKRAVIGIQPEYRLGDANRDGNVNITDAMVAINHGLKGTYDEASDVNSDGKVTVADHTPIINHILGKESL